MLVVRERRAAIGHHHDLEIEHHGVPCRRLTAHVGLGARDQDGVDPEVAQHPLEAGGAGDQRTVAVLDDGQVLWRRGELAPDPLAAGRQTFDRLLAHLVRHHVVEKHLPVAALAVPGIGVQDPDHRDIPRPQLGRERVDVGDDCARRRYLGGRARLAEGVLHVDDHKRGLGGIEHVEPVNAAAAGEDAVKDLAAYFCLMHGVTS